MELDTRQTIVVAILVLFFGQYLTKKIKFLRTFNIPESVTGGTIASVVFGLLMLLFNFEIDFSLQSRDVLLVVFFTTIGLSAKWKNIISGGRPMLIMFVLSIIFLFIQNFIGIGLLLPFEDNINAGLLGGSVALIGGHGATIAWAPVFSEEYGLENALAIGMTVATFGLILGGILGGPVTKWLIKKNKLESKLDEPITIGKKHKSTLSIDADSMLNAILYIFISIGLGALFSQLFSYFGLIVPLFVTCLLGGLIFTNLIPLIFHKIKCPEHSPTLSMVSDISLGLFLVMSLMSIRIWEVVEYFLPVFIVIVVQVIVIVVFVVFVMFRLLGKDYEAAVMSAGFIGLGLGATPVAMANMSAISKEHGPAPKAFIIIPIIGAFIMNFFNAIVIQLMLVIFN